ncbi:MAG: hypothetical protein NVS3B26_22790 [Mycobacteriales bacterium]
MWSFGDRAVSRSRGDRPGLLEMLAFSEEHDEVGCIVVTELERITAGNKQRVQLDDFCRRRDITLLYERGRVDPNDEDEIEEADRKALDACIEVRKNQERTRSTMHPKARKRR